MVMDAWLPVGFSFFAGLSAKQVTYDGGDWQIYEASPNSSVLVASEKLADQWISSKLLEPGMLHKIQFGENTYCCLSSDSERLIRPISECNSPRSNNEALMFAETLRLTREIDKDSPLQDSIYVEKYSRLLPTYSLSNPVVDDIILGYWLTGGVPVSINSTRRMNVLTGWLRDGQLEEIIEKSKVKHNPQLQSDCSQKERGPFALAGRPELQNFINEHIIDLIKNADRYKALGIEFPSAMVLYGPPGCGKTFAVERLIEYLGWPSYQIEASSVASPYVHETSRKIASVFDQAIENSPAVIVIDEMEAFLSDRKGIASSGHHHIEEVSEFLRRIPEAVNSHVLVIGMTNQIEMIDSAILRRGRFDHIVEVGMATEVEVSEMIKCLIGNLPQEQSIDIAALAQELCGRPLSDVAFVVREGARLAARAGKDKIDQECFDLALGSTSSREDDIDQSNRIGYI